MFTLLLTALIFLSKEAAVFKIFEDNDFRRFERFFFFLARFFSRGGGGGGGGGGDNGCCCRGYAAIMV